MPERQVNRPIKSTTSGDRASARSPASRALPAVKLVLLSGLIYPFLPIDIVPDRLPWIGHLDNVGFPAVGFVAALMLVGERVGAGPGRALGATIVGKRLVRALMPLFRLCADSVLGRFVLRLMLGRWPDAAEHQAFLRGLWATSHALPPLLRAAACVPAARVLLSRGVLLHADFTEAQRMGNPLTVWRGPKVRFMHIEKTAGSSLVSALAAQFHPLQIHSEPAGRPAPEPHAGPHLGPHDPAVAAHRGAALVWGHYDLPSLIRLDGDAPCFRLCLLREPSERILSLYYFWRANRDQAGSLVRLARDCGLLDFLRKTEPAICNEIDNLYVRRLTGLYATAAADPLAVAPEAALSAAIRALDGLDFVGLSEDLGGALAALGQRLGFTPPSRTPLVNVQAALERNALLSVRPSARAPLTPEIRAELQRLSRLDRVLYRRAAEQSG